MSAEREFLKNFTPLISKFKTVKITNSDILKIQKVACTLLGVRDLNQLRDKYEGVHFYNKLSKEIMGEIALEKFLNVSIVDWKGRENKRNQISQLNNLGLNIGISTNDYGDWPLSINKEITRPEIILIKKKDNTIYICGLASVKTLVENSKDSVPNMIQSRIPFTGIDQLQPFSNLEELKTLSIEV